MLKPYEGRVFDPCCGSGGMFVQSEKFIKNHQGRLDNNSIYGQESNQTTWRLAKMNLAIRGIDASDMGYMMDRCNRAFDYENDILKIAKTYHHWKSDTGTYEDIKGFCKSTTLEEITKHKFVLTPGRHVGIPDEEDDGIPFEDKMNALTGQLKEQMEEAQKLDIEIKKQLSKIGFEI
ncbi:MAG: SAM-dependent methyltransferase [Proteobacteria bacterium]|nr:SAM-dependent methyltransferase [Pseudomonadota bacterium]